MTKHQYLSKRIKKNDISPPDGSTLSGSRLDFENLTQSEAREPPTSGCKTVMGPYNGAGGVQCPFIYIYNGKTSISKKESDACLCAVAIHCPITGSMISKI